EETKNICPPSNACANSADGPYIPSPKGLGFTAHWGRATLPDKNGKPDAAPKRPTMKARKF
ncbi:hypothetical protein, partial [Centipeda periodontii]|uniref:hypothetical protein n=1 Tax=Centipeda periodontii TaxID=82203 RepID=UPI001C54CEF5